jgi:tetratricopeptide (TPR) repeat protein
MNARPLRRKLPVVLIALASSLLAPGVMVADARPDPAASSDPSPIPAADALRALCNREIIPNATLAQAKAALDKAAAETSEAKAQARWILGQALVARAEARLLDARTLMDRAAALAPGDAEIQAWQGTAILESIGAVSRGLFDKAEQADLGVAAYERALKLDPGQIDAHIGLAQYYLRAPGLFGGSLRKARQCAQTLLTLDEKNPSGPGVSYAHIILGQVAAYRGDDAEMNRQFDLAEAAAGQPCKVLIVLNARAWSHIQDRKQYARAAAIFSRCIQLAPECSTYHFGLGEALRLDGKFAEAASSYAKAIELQPLAASSRFALAQCLEKLGKKPEAAEQFTLFASQHPDDPRIDDARSAAKRLAKG